MELKFRTFFKPFLKFHTNAPEFAHIPVEGAVRPAPSSPRSTRRAAGGQASESVWEHHEAFWEHHDAFWEHHEAPAGRRSGDAKAKAGARCRRGHHLDWLLVADWRPTQWVATRRGLVLGERSARGSVLGPGQVSPGLGLPLGLGLPQPSRRHLWA